MILENMIRKEVKDMPPSGIRKFFDIVNEMEDVISLGVGEPDFVTPWNIREAGIAHIPEDRYMWGSAPEATLAENALMGYEDSEEFSKKGNMAKS